MGHSFGARSALLAALQEPRTVALVSLDGGIGAATAKTWLDADPGLDPAAARFALLHLYETEDAVMAPDFALFERMRLCSRRLVHLPSLHHRHFSSYGFAAAAIPELKDADAATVGGIQALAAQAIAFLDAAFGRPVAESLADELPPGVTWSADTATRRAVPGPVSRLRVDDGGASDRTPVVFVHGNGASLTHWSEALAHVRASRRAVALDLRGNGESQPVREARYGVEDVAQDVGAVADALGLGRFVLVGHSYGGSVVGAYAAAHPERVAGLLLVDPAGDVTQAPADALDRYVARLEERGLRPGVARGAPGEPLGREAGNVATRAGRARGRVARGVRRLLRGAATLRSRRGAAGLPGGEPSRSCRPSARTTRPASTACCRPSATRPFRASATS